MHTDGIILLALDAALLAAILIALINIGARLERIERRVFRTPRKKSVKKKD